MLWISFYFTVQDMAFILACSVQNAFSSIYEIVSFAIGVVFGIIIVAMLFWGFYIINFPPPDNRHHQYEHMFLLCYDYDLYPTYDLLDLPERKKQLARFSNLRLAAVVMKVAYSFLIVGYLRENDGNLSSMDEVYAIAGFLVFFELSWLLALPMNIKK